MPRDIQYTKLLGPQVEITMTNGPDYEGTYSASTTYAAGDVVGCDEADAADRVDGLWCDGA